MSFFFPLTRDRSAAPGQPLNHAGTRLIQQHTHTRPLFATRFDPTGRFVFAGAQDNDILRWDLNSGTKVALAGHRSWVRALAFVPGANQLISGSYDGKIIWWPAHAEVPAPIRTIDGHDGWVRALSVSADGRMLASCGNDNLVKIWSAANGTLIREIPGHTRHVYNVAFHPGGQFVVSGDLMGNVKQWEVATGREVRSFDATVLHRYDNTFAADIGGIRSIAFNHDGSLFACAGITNVSNAFAGIGNPCFVLFDWQTGQRRQVLRPREEFRGTGWGVAFHPDGTIIGTGSGQGGGMWFWRGNEANSFASVRLPSNSFDLDLHPDGYRLALPYYDRNLRVYDLRSA
jgi:WD40 repeat protein